MARFGYLSPEEIKEELGVEAVSGREVGDATPESLVDVQTGDARYAPADAALTDGDKGDIVVSASGAMWTLDPAVVTTFARSILDDADADEVRGTIGAATSGANSDITSLAGLTTALSVAQGGTGDTGTAWITYTPTVSAASGTFSSVSTSGRYKRLGKTVFLQVRVNITTNGSAAGYVSVTAPFVAAGTNGTTGTGDQWAFAGQETAAVGFALQGTLPGTASLITLRKYDASYPGADGYTLQIAGVYEAV